MVEQGGPDALHPAPALVGQGLVEPHPGPDFEYVVRGDPGLGQLAAVQQIPQEAGIGPVGLGSLLAAALLSGVGRLGQMGLGPHPLELVDDEAPTRAPFEGEGDVAASVEAPQPRPHLGAIRGGDLAPDRLARVGVHVVERDLPAMNVQSSYDSHGGLLELQQLVLDCRNDRAAEPRRPPFTCSFRVSAHQYPCYIQSFRRSLNSGRNWPFREVHLPPLNCPFVPFG